MPNVKPKVQLWTRMFWIFVIVAIILCVVLECFILRRKNADGFSRQVFRVKKIGDMQQIAKFRIFASDYQFYICDPDRATNESEMFGAVMNLTQADHERGWTRTSSTITCFTIEDRNNHRIDIFVGKEYDGHNDATRVLCQTLNLSKGRLDIFCGPFPDEVEIHVPPGDYSIYVRGFNFGVGTEKRIENNEEFLARSDMERYEIVLVPGKAAKEGIVFGPEKLYDIITTP